MPRLRIAVSAVLAVPLAQAFALAMVFALAACTREQRATTPKPVPTPSVQVGTCATPGRDGVVGAAPQLERADRDLNGDGVAEVIVADRTLCTAEGNCHWNVFVVPPAGSPDCARYAGTFDASLFERLTTKGDDNMVDIRGYWNLHGGRLLLQSYRFLRGGYRIVDALVCRSAGGDKLDCADTGR